MLSALFAHVKQGFTFVPTLNLFSKRLKEPCFLVLFKAYKINWLYVKQVWPAGAQDRVPGPILAHAGIQFWKNTTDDLRKYLLFSPPPPHIPSIPIRVSDSHAPLWAICLSLSAIKYYIKKKKKSVHEFCTENQPLWKWCTSFLVRGVCLSSDQCEKTPFNKDLIFLK